MKTFWNNLNEREHWLLGLGGVMFVVYLGFTLIYAPIFHSVHDKELQLIEKNATYAWMQQMQATHTAIQMPKTLNASALLTIFAERLKLTTFNRFKYQLEQTGDGDIQLSFDKVPYNAFITWLFGIREQYSFLIKDFKATSTNVPGIVSLMLVIH